MNRYNLLFLGSKFNEIYSHELPQSLKTFFNFDIDIKELNELIPLACKTLNMDIEPLKKFSDLGNPDADVYSYLITLWR